MDMPLIESMLLSKDKEIRKSAIDYIETNYDVNFAVFYSQSKDKFYLFGTDSDYFMYMNVILFNISIECFPTASYIQEIINLILEYNEKYK